MTRHSVRLAAVGLALAGAGAAVAAPPGPLDSAALFGPAAGRSRTTLFEWPDCGAGCDTGCDDAGGAGGGENGGGDGGAEPLVAERPDFTNSPGTVGLGVAQLELGYRFTYDGGPAGETRVHTVPEGLLRAGVGVGWLELRLGGAELIEEGSGGGGDDPDPGNVADRRDGTEGLDLGLKVGLFPQAGALPETAVITTLTVPLASDLGRVDRPLSGNELVLGWEVTEELRVAGSTQLNRVADDDGREIYTEFAQSLTAGYAPTDRFGVYAEYYVLDPLNARTAETEHYADAGFTLLLTEDLQYDAFAGTGLNGPADDFFAGTGLVVRFR